jgi:ketosteroid isomerase-like protein
MRSFVTRLVALSLLAAGLVGGGVAASAQRDEREVLAATAQFYKALNTMFTGDVEPMKKVWSHAEDVTYMGPGGGFRVGWKQVLADWEAQAAMKLGGRVEAADNRVSVGRDLAVISNYEKGENKGPDGKPLVVSIRVVSIRATSVFRKEEGQWKMIGHHTDLLPYLSR